MLRNALRLLTPYELRLTALHSIAVQERQQHIRRHILVKTAIIQLTIP